jgi:hypothetical protein
LSAIVNQKLTMRGRERIHPVNPKLVLPAAEKVFGGAREKASLSARLSIVSVPLKPVFQRVSSNFSF